jgi:hypothetical protein
MRANNPRLILIFILFLVLTYGCSGLQKTSFTPLPATPMVETFPHATPVAESPAAGICATSEGMQVTITIYPDIPDPRCSLIRPEQILKVVNAREDPLLVSIGQMEAEIAPGSSYLFDLPFGKYLAPGVHRIEVQPCCGAELWLQNQ